MHHEVKAPVLGWSFVRYLDTVLLHFYDCQYTGLRAGFIAKQEVASGNRTEHFNCIIHHELVDLIHGPNDPKHKEHTQTIAKFVVEQLITDGLITRTTLEKQVENTHYFITNKGRLFWEAGGYSSLEKDREKSIRLKNTTIAARIAETLTLIAIAFFTAYLQFDDSEKDELIIDLRKEKAVLEQRVSDLERSVLRLQDRLLPDAQEQKADSIPFPP